VEPGRNGETAASRSSAGHLLDRSFRQGAAINDPDAAGGAGATRHYGKIVIVGGPTLALTPA
jgi:hypothetical protein